MGRDREGHRSRPSASALLVACVTVTAVALVACGNTPRPNTAHLTPPVATTERPSASPASTAPAGTSSPSTCSAPELAATASQGSGAGGHQSVVVVLRNAGREACTLEGYPDAHFALVDGTVLNAQTVDVGPAPRLVTLAPGSTASTTVWSTNPTVPSASACRPETTARVTVTLPPSAATVATPVTVSVCTADEIVQDTAVVPGSTATVF